MRYAAADVRRWQVAVRIFDAEGEPAVRSQAVVRTSSQASARPIRRSTSASRDDAGTSAGYMLTGLVSQLYAGGVPLQPPPPYGRVRVHNVSHVLFIECATVRASPQVSTGIVE